jgi:hypothetical protein
MFGLKMYNLATLVPVSDKTKMNLDGKTRRRLQLENKISAEENDMFLDDCDDRSIWLLRGLREHFSFPVSVFSEDSRGEGGRETERETERDRETERRERVERERVERERDSRERQREREIVERYSRERDRERYSRERDRERYSRERDRERYSRERQRE